MSVAEGVRKEDRKAAGAALGGGYTLSQTFFCVVGEYLDGVLVFGTVVVKVLVPFQGQHTIFEADFGEGNHGYRTHRHFHVFQRYSSISYPVKVDEGVAGGHGVLRGIVAQTDLEGRKEF